MLIVATDAVATAIAAHLRRTLATNLGTLFPMATPSPGRSLRRWGLSKTEDGHMTDVSEEPDATSPVRLNGHPPPSGAKFCPGYASAAPPLPAPSTDSA